MKKGTFKKWLDRLFGQPRIPPPINRKDKRTRQSIARRQKSLKDRFARQ